MNLVPRLGEHVAIVGRTGSGKTTTAVQLLRPIANTYPIVIIDSKGDDTLEGITPRIITDIKHALKFDGTFIYRPEDEWNEPEYLDSFMHRLYTRRRSCVVYVDEAYQLCPTSTRPGRGYANGLMRGRYRRVKRESAPVRMSIVSSTQRPAWVPRQIFTESNRFFIHALAEDDLKKMSGYVGDRSIITKPPSFDDHEFWYFDVNRHHRAKVKLNLGA